MIAAGERVSARAAVEVRRRSQFDSATAAEMGRRSRGGGRPANHVRQLVGKASEEAVLKLREIAINEKDRYPGDEQLAGRIPTAIDRHWSINLNEGLILPESDLQELYAGLDKQKTTVVYCLAGWRASPSWIVLKSLGFRDVRVYDGFWFEWGPPGPFPIETTG